MKKQLIHQYPERALGKALFEICKKVLTIRTTSRKFGIKRYIARSPSWYNLGRGKEISRVVNRFSKMWLSTESYKKKVTERFLKYYAKIVISDKRKN